jgi:hypothetical protein
MNPVVTAYIKQELNISRKCSGDSLENIIILTFGNEVLAPQNEYRAQFYDALIDETCLGTGTVSPTQATNQSECLSTRSCNWALCNNFDSPDTCTQGTLTFSMKQVIKLLIQRTVWIQP